MDIKAREATEDEKALVRHITFRSKSTRSEGCVTGIPLPMLSGPLRVMMVSAGCVYAPAYVIQPGDTLVSIERI